MSPSSRASLPHPTLSQPSRLSRSPGLSSPSRTANVHWLSVLHIGSVYASTDGSAVSIQRLPCRWEHCLPTCSQSLQYSHSQVLHWQSAFPAPQKTLLLIVNKTLLFLLEFEKGQDRKQSQWHGRQTVLLATIPSGPLWILRKQTDAEHQQHSQTKPLIQTQFFKTKRNSC